MPVYYKKQVDLLMSDGITVVIYNWQRMRQLKRLKFSQSHRYL